MTIISLYKQTSSLVSLLEQCCQLCHKHRSCTAGCHGWWLHGYIFVSLPCSRLWTWQWFQWLRWRYRPSSLGSECWRLWDCTVDFIDRCSPLHRWCTKTKRIKAVRTRWLDRTFLQRCWPNAIRQTVYGSVHVVVVRGIPLYFEYVFIVRQWTRVICWMWRVFHFHATLFDTPLIAADIIDTCHISRFFLLTSLHSGLARGPASFRSLWWFCKHQHSVRLVVSQSLDFNCKQKLSSYSS